MFKPLKSNKIDFLDVFTRRFFYGSSDFDKLYKNINRKNCDPVFKTKLGVNPPDS
jgi:hypothetical protein